MKQILILLFLIFITSNSLAGRLQNVDFMTEAELVTAGSSKAALLNDDKIYVGAIAKTLDQAILDGDIGGGIELTAKGNLVGFGLETEECILDKTDGKLLTVDSTATCGFDFKDAPVSLPDQTNKDQHILTTNGTSASWVADLPSKIKQNYSKTGLLLNPSFEDDGTSWTIAETNCPVTYSGGGAVITCTGGTFSIKQNVDLSSIKENESLSNQLIYKSDVQGVKWSILSNDVRQAELDFSDSNKLENTSLVSNTVDAVNNGIEVHADSAITGTIFISNVRMKHEDITHKETSTFIQSLFAEGGTRASSGKITNYTVTSARGEDLLTYSSGTWTSQYDNVSVTASMWGQVNTADSRILVRFSIDGVLHESGSDSFDSASGYRSSATSGMILNKGDSLEFWTDGAGNMNRLSPSFTAIYVAPTSSTITQDTELTAKTANSFGINVSNTGVVTGDVYDFIDGDCTNAYPMVCVWNTGIFTKLPSCSIGIEKTSNGEASKITTLSDITIYTGDSDGVGNAGISFSLDCDKTGVDVNKSQTVAGNFSQIRSDDLISIHYGKPVAQNVPNNTNTTINFDSLVNDNSNGAYNTSTGRFTSPKEGATEYRVCINWLWDTSSFPVGTVFDFRTEVNGGAKPFEYLDRHESTNATSKYHSSFGKCVNVKLEKNDYFDIIARQNSGGARFNLASSEYTHMTINEIATKESIVANIMKGQTKECETKFLSADVSSDGVITDLTFSNLIVGKKYSIIGQIAMYTNGGDNYALVRTKEGSNIVNETACGANTTVNYCSRGLGDIFTATATTLTSEAASMIAADVVTGNGTKTMTYVTLCLEPETTILK